VKVLAVVPAFDEAATITQVVAGVRAHVPVLVVDDGSTDGTGSRADAAGAVVLRHPRRLGKAQALRTGVAAARAWGATVIVTLDGDGQHDPAHIPRLLAALAPRTIVVGGRLHDAEALPADRLNAMRVAGFFIGWAAGLRVADTQSGYRAYPLELFEEVSTWRSGFVFETEILLAASAGGWSVREIPVPAIARAARRSRFRPLRDGAAIGTYLAGAVVRRAGREAIAGVEEIASVFGPERRQIRHAALLAEAASYADSPSWGLALGAAAVNRLGARLAWWWRHPRWRRGARVAGGAAATPLVLPLMVVQMLAGSWLPDVVTPLVARIYAEPIDGGRAVAPPPDDVVLARDAVLTRPPR
jgi:hypothetical protein